LLGRDLPPLPAPQEGMEVDTLAGLLLALAERLPEPDEIVVSGAWEFSAVERVGNRLSLIRLTHRNVAQEISRATDSDEGQEPSASS